MRLPILAALLAILVSPATLHSEEGMWTFDNLPLKALKAQHAFEPNKAWLDHLRLASVRLSGGSASFVSADGLVLTNHHMVRGNVQRLSTRERDLLKDGFVAATREQELKVPGLEVFVLVAMENISERVLQAGQIVKTEAEALRARERETQKAREEMRTKTGLTVEPVALYQGGETWLYVYRKFTDVRLVMAPELSVARFGGDHDNFTYPRHHLDFAMVRVYEAGKPYRPEAFIQWSAGGLKTGELALVSGHPGTTNRLWTLAQMEYARDFGTPLQVAASGRRRAILEAFAQRSFEARSQVGGQIYGIDNGLKATKGYLAGLKDVEALKAVARTETELKKRVAADPKLKALAGGSWAQVQKALIESRKLALELMLVNARGSELLGIALHLVRLPVEVGKTETIRLSEYSTAALVPLKTRLTQARSIPFNPELELHLLTEGLKEAQLILGKEHRYIKAMLGGRSPETVAQEAVAGSRLQDPVEVKRLLEGGASVLATCVDPMVVLARKLDPLQRQLRERSECLVEGPLREHAARIARARFAAYGKDTYPDATSTLRLSYGTVKDYPANGTLIQPFTTMLGLFDRYEGWGGAEFNLNRDTWRLPSRWLERKDKLDLRTPYNLITTNDIIGGNSGSPVVDRKGELVGLAFDGNQESLAGRYYYDERTNRTVCVDARAIREVLTKIYDAEHLVKELMGTK